MAVVLLIGAAALVRRAQTRRRLEEALPPAPGPVPTARPAGAAASEAPIPLRPGWDAMGDDPDDAA